MVEPLTRVELTWEETADFREWVMEKNVFKHVIFAVSVDHMFFAQELIEYVSDYDY